MRIVAENSLGKTQKNGLTSLANFGLRLDPKTAKIRQLTKSQNPNTKTERSQK